MIRKNGGILTSVGLMVVIAALTVFFTGQAMGQVKSLKYGLVIPLSGNAAPWGIAHERGVRIACEDINSRGGFTAGGQAYKWEPLVFDCKYDVKETRTGVERMVNQEGCKYVAIMGTANALGSEDVLLQNKVLLMGQCYGGQKFSNPQHPLWFRIVLTTKERPIAFYPWLKAKEGVKKVALITQDTEGGAVSLEEGKAAAKIAGLDVVAEERYESGTTDFYSVLTRALAKKPDMIDTTLAAGDEPALLTKQARELGFKGVMYIGTLTDPPSFVKTAGIQNAEGAYMAGLPVDLTTDMQKRFKDLYVKKYGENEWNPDTFEYAIAVYVLNQGFIKANSIETTKVAEVLGSMELDTFSGKGRFGGESVYGIRRQIVIPDYLAVFKNGKPVQAAVVAPPAGY